MVFVTPDLLVLVRILFLFIVFFSVFYEH